MTVHGAETSSLHRLLELAAELQRLRSVVLGSAVPGALRDEIRDTEDPDEAADDGPIAQEDISGLIDFLTGVDDPVIVLEEVFTRFRALHLAEPTVAEVVMSFLTGLGKTYAATEEGAELLAGLHRSESAEQLRRLWVALTLNTIDSGPELSARSWTDTVLDLSLTGDLSKITASLRPDGLA